MKKGALQIIITVLLGISIACTLAFIIGSSLLNVEESTAQSAGAYEVVKPIAEFFTGKDNFPIEVFRNCAHFVEYFMFGLEVTLLFAVLNYFKFKTAIMVLFFGLFVAVADEAIQIVTGRGPEILDVLIDYGGYLLAVAIVVLIKFVNFLRSIDFDKPKEAKA